MFVRSGFKYWLCAESAYQKSVRNWPCKTVKYPSARRAMFKGMCVCVCVGGGGGGGPVVGERIYCQCEKTGCAEF